jgi:hypothetical protein
MITRICIISLSWYDVKTRECDLRVVIRRLEMGSSIDTRTLFAATAAKYAALAQAGQPLFPPQYGASSSRYSTRDHTRESSY